MVSGQRVRIRLRSFDGSVLDAAVRSIVETVKSMGASISGPIPLPTRIRRITVNRSVHVNVTSKEQFEMKVHSRLVDIYNTTSDIMGSLMGIELSSGVDIEVRQ